MAAGTKEVILEGFLGEKYGRKWNIVATEYKDIFECIAVNYPESRKDLIDFYNAGGDISIQTGESIMQEPEEFLHPIAKGSIIVTPIPTGSKSGSAKILAAVLIVAFIWALPMMGPAIAGFFGAAGGGVAGGLTTITFLESIALGLAVNLAVIGIQQLLAPDPSVDDNDTNYLFNGPENTVVSGNPVPVLCGEMMVGGIVISSGSIGGFWAAEATYIEEPVPDEGVTGNRYNPATPPPGAVFVGGKYTGPTQITVNSAPTAPTVTIQNAVDDQNSGIKMLGTDEFVMSAP